MSNFLYGFPDTSSMGFHSPSAVNVMNPVSRSVTGGFIPDSGHYLHHHPHHHPHLTVRPTMTPAPRQRHSNSHQHHHMQGILTTMSPSRSLYYHSTTTSPAQLLHQSSSSADNVHSSLDYMKGYLHTDFGDTILFKSWILKSTWDTVLTCLAFFLLAILYEGIKCYREHLYKRLSFAVKKQVTVLSASSLSSTHHLHHHHHLHGSNGSTNSSNQQPCRRPESSSHTGHASPLDPTTPASLFQRNINKDSILLRLFSIPHAAQSLLHTIQAMLSYTLMLSFMTFNVYICLSIIAGTGIGYFMFCWRRITVVHVSDCHWSWCLHFLFTNFASIFIIIKKKRVWQQMVLQLLWHWMF